jgi:tetratricopeptide (TPR) repeat protein
MLLAHSVNLMASGGVGVDAVRVSAEEGTALIEIIFNCPNRFLDYYPQEATDTLQIRFMATGQCSALRLRTDRQLVDLPDDHGDAALVSMDYESQQEGDAVLTVKFSRAINAAVSQPADQRQLRISVETGELDDTDVTAALLEPLGGKADGNREDPGVGAALGDMPMSEPQLASLMGEGESAFQEQNYDRAIQVYTRVLRAPENAHTPRALELLGLSRERNGQISQSVAEYRRYLEYYPDNEGSERVNQRLAGLTTAHKTPMPGRVNGEVAAPPSEWDVYGGIAQYYRNDTFNLEGQGSINAQSSILTNADLLFQRTGARVDFSGRATLGNFWDLLGEDEGPGSETRIYQGYVDVNDRVTGLGGRLGRQTLRYNGVLGRFDGLHLSWEFKPGMQFNVIGGYPVDTTGDGVQTDRYFYGVAMDFEEVADLVDLSVFYNRQIIDGMENREAVGTELRYFDDTKSLVALVDYDIGFKKLNNFVLLGNWNVWDGLTLSASADQRTTPYLTTENALIGQPVATIEELLLLYSGDEIRQMAERLSGKVTSYHLGASQSLSDRFQLNADATMSEFNASEISDSMPGYLDQATQYYFNLNLVGYRLFMDGDTSIFGLRYVDSGSTSTSTLYLDSRFPLSRKFQINPRFGLSYRDSKTYTTDSWIAVPSLRLLYRINRRYRLEFEGGGQWINQDSASNVADRTSWFVYFGYRADF